MDNEMKTLTAMGNVKLGEDHVICTINPKIYSLDTVQSAAYILMDRAYILLEGDPETEIRVEIRQKRKPVIDFQDLAIEFNEQLLNYAVYKAQNERNKLLREIMMQRVLLTNASTEVIKKHQAAEEQKRQEAHKKVLQDGTKDTTQPEVLLPDSH